MRKYFGVFVFMALAIFVENSPVFAQTANRSYYVSANGDDENNNGRSEEAPFKTLAKAIEMASKGAVKTITVLGTLYGEDERGPINQSNYVFVVSFSGSQELLITGKSDVSDEERAILSGSRHANTIVGVFLGSDAKVKFENIEISGCISGGGMNVSSGTVSLGTGVKITHNKGQYYAGGLLVGRNAIVTLDGAEISENNSGRDFGGGVVVEGGRFIMNNGIITNNIDIGTGSRCGGGGIWLGGGTLEIKGGIISGNTARRGGGVFIAGGSFTMTGGEIIGNKAKEGGGICNYGNNCSITNGTIRANNAEYGAGIYVGKNANFGNKPTITVSAGTITENSADFVGGGIYVATGATLTQTGGTVRNNSAGDGEGENIFRQ